MIRLLEGLPDRVGGIEAVGRVEADDYVSVLEPAVESALGRSERIRLVYLLGDEFDGYSMGAGWADTKLGIEHWGAWEKIAVVTDHRWIADGVKALGWMLPGEARVFPTDRQAEAIEWASA